MNVKNYRGKTAEECIKKLKSELGADAVILQSRTVRSIFGRFGQVRHEIVAAGDAEAVLDELTDRAGERLQQNKERDAVSVESAEPALPPIALQNEPRLTLSSSSAGNAALNTRSQPVARRERLTLAEAAELHERGATDRLVAAGILRSPGAPRVSEEGAASKDFRLIYSNAAQPGTNEQPSSLAGGESSSNTSSAKDDSRFARLERQIALLTAALAKQSDARTAVGSPAIDLPKRTPSPALPPAAREEAASPLTASQAMPAAPPAQPSETSQPTSAGVGGFLRYRLPAQNAERAAKTQQPAKSAPMPRPRQAPLSMPQNLLPAELGAQAETLAPTSAQVYLDRLRAAQVAEPLLRRLSAELPPDLDAASARETIHDLLAQRMLIGGAISPSVGKMTLAALLGPTGVGKTTTVAKLAANLSLTTTCRVAMVTLDTSRVAAADQLKGYGDAMNIPVHVAYDKAELESVLTELAEKKTQVVLIDTPGRGPLETLTIAEMSQSLRSIVDLRSYVVVPAPLSASNFENTIQRFIKLAKPTAVILTKMDETADNHCLGFLLNSQAKYQLPLAYVTMGGRVPDDLLVADAHLLVNKLMAVSMA